MRPLSYGRQSIDEDDIKAVVDVLRGDFLTQGPMIERFEAALAERVGAKYVVAVCNGTAALHIACLAAGIGPGDRGLTSPVTFVASANCLRYCGADVVLADIDPDSLCLEPDVVTLALAADPAICAVIPVHFAGLAADMAGIRAVAGDRVVIEDACHALGALTADGRPVGCCAHSDMTVFSFHPVKPMTTGEGGAIATNDAELARRLRLLRCHGIEREPARLTGQELEEGGRVKPWLYEQQDIGFNYRLTEIQAALGLSQLGKLGSFIERRRAIAHRYDLTLKGRPGIRPLQASAAQRERSGHHLYVVDVDFAASGTTRSAVMAALSERGIGTQVHYIPIHRQPYHAARLTQKPSDLPNAEAYYAGCLSLPIFPAMVDSDVDRVVEALQTVLGV